MKKTNSFIKSTLIKILVFVFFISMNVDAQAQIIDAGITTMLSPLAPHSAAPKQVRIRVRNFGNTPIDSVIIGWTYDGVVQPDFKTPSIQAPSVNVQTPFQDVILNANFTYGSGKNFVFYVKKVNTQADVNTSNDTLRAYTGSAPISGTKIIGSAPSDYRSFKDAVNAIRYSGVSGNIIFKAKPGTYEDNIELVAADINYTAPNSTITFETQTGLRDVLLISEAAVQATVRLNGADRITLNNLRIVNRNIISGIGVHLLNSADRNTIKNCEIIVDSISNHRGFAGIMVASMQSYPNSTLMPVASGKHTTIYGNKISGGYYGIVMMGATSPRDSSQVVDSNVINQVVFCGVSIENSVNAKVRKNHVRFRPSASLLSAGYSLKTVSTVAPGNIEITRNYVFGAGQYGIFLSAVTGTPDNTTNRFVNLYNNMVAGGFLSNTTIVAEVANGIHITNNSGNINVYFNSVLMDAPTRPGNVDNTVAFYVYSTSSAGKIKVYNNIFANANKGYSYYNASSAATNPVTISNNNNLYVALHDPNTNPTTGYAWWNGGARISLPLLIASSAKDQNSVNVPPQFFSSSDLHTLSAELDKKGSTAALSEVPIDYDGQLRDQQIAPDIGCDEFESAAADWAITEISPEVFRYQRATPWKITVRYQGAAGNGNQKLYFRYKINGVDMLSGEDVIEHQFTNLGGYFSTETFTVQPPAYHITRNNFGSFKLTVYIYTGNTGDGRSYNDSFTIDACVGLEGTFSINKNQPTAGTNFSSFQDVYEYLKCGVAGPTVFEIYDGVYDEQINLWNIRNSSTVNNILFKSKNNVFSTVLTYANGTAENHATVLFNSARHITLKDLTIENRSLSNGSCIQLSGNSQFNTIRECILKIDSTAISYPSTLVALVSSKLGSLILAPSVYGINSNSNNILNNKIYGGYYGIAMFGQDTTQRDKGNIVQGNIITSFHKTGIYLEYADTKILNNTIGGKFGMDPAGFGIQLRYLGDREGIDLNEIAGNQIYDITMQGISVVNCLGRKIPFARKSTFAIMNNMIGGGFSSNSNLSNIAGIHLTNSAGISVLHNTVNVDAPRTFPETLDPSLPYARCFVARETNYDIEAINNIFYSGNGAIPLEYYTKIAAQNGGLNGLKTADYNLYYTTARSKSAPLVLIRRHSNLQNNPITNYTFNQRSGSPLRALTQFKNDPNNAGRDRRSIALPITFEELPYNLHTYDLTVESQAAAGQDVVYDFDKELRGGSNIDIGADEFTVPNYDLDVWKVRNPLLSSVKPNKIQVRLRNRGKYTLNNSRVALECTVTNSDGFSFTTVDTVRLTMIKTGSFQDHIFTTAVSVPTRGYYDVCVKVKNPEPWVKGSANNWIPQDTVHYNDRKCVNICTGIEGDFYIGFGVNDLPGVSQQRKYNTIQQAFNGVECGIADDTWFNVNPQRSPYLERVLIPKYLVALDSPLLTLQPYNTTSNTAVEINQPASPGNALNLHYTVRFNGANFIKLKNLNIKNSNSSHGSAVHFTRKSVNNIVEGCKIEVNSTATTSLFYPIAFTSTLRLDITDESSNAKNGSSNRIVRNEIIGGYAGVAMLGASQVDFDEYNVLDSNIIRDYYQFGVYTRNNSIKSISFNSLTPRANTSPSCVSLSYNYGEAGGIINANKIVNSKQIGIKVYGVDAYPDDPLIVSNNWLTHSFSNSVADTSAAIFIKRSNNIGVYYNSIRYNGFVSAFTISRDSLMRVLEPGQPAVTVYFNSTNIKVNNNIISVDQMPSPLKIPLVVDCNSVDALTRFNQNAYWTDYAPQRFAYYPRLLQNTFELWQQNTIHDKESIYKKPVFVSQYDLNLHPSDTLQFDGKALPVAGIARDYNNRKRNPRFTDIGSLEYESKSVDVSILNIVNNKGVYGRNYFSVTLLNDGNDDLTGQNICLEYSVDSGRTWQGNEQVTLSKLKGRYDEEVFTFANPYMKTNLITIPLCVRIVCRLPNDNVLEYEKICKDLCVGLDRGVYTIGKNGFEDFQTITQAVDGLVCGFDSSIVFKISPGNYFERVTIPYLRTHFDTTITFVSSTGNAKDVVIEYNNTVEVVEHHIVQLFGASHITFKDLTFKSKATARASGIHLADSASYNTIERCIFNFDSVSQSNTLVGVLASGSIGFSNTSTASNNNIRSCEFNGGGFGIRLIGSKEVINKGPNQIISSKFKNNYTAAIDVFYAQIDSLSNNKIKMRDGNINGVGINIYGALTDFIITSNRINNAQNIGLNIDSCRTISRGLIANNMIAGKFVSDELKGDYGLSIKNTGAFPNRGIPHTGTIDIINNSILYDGASPNGAAFHIQNANGFRVINNIFANYGSGYAIVYGTEPNPVTEFYLSEVNLLYTRGPKLAKWKGIICTDINELGMQDLGNSPFNIGKSPGGKTFDPMFRSNLDLHVNNADLNNKGIQGFFDLVPVDIDGTPRSPTVPDVGCDEFTPEFDMAIDYMLNPVNGQRFKDSVSVSVQVKNVGAPINTIKVKYVLNGTLIDSVVKNYVSVPLATGATDILHFTKKFSTRQGGEHTLGVYSEIKKLDIATNKFVNNDFNNLNDTVWLKIISLDTADIGVDRFLNPGNNVTISGPTPVEVRVTNYGNLPAKNYSLILKVNDKIKETKYINTELRGRQSNNFVFDYKLDPDSAVFFDVCAYTVLSDDIIRTNDMNCIIVKTGTVGIEGDKAAGLFAVYPNPTTGMLNFAVDIRQEKDVILKVYDLSGRLMRDDNFGVMKEGAHKINVNYNDLAEGTYFFVMIAGEDKYNGRFVIIK